MARLKSFNVKDFMTGKGRIIRPFLWLAAGLFFTQGYGQKEQQLSLSFNSLNYSEVSSLHSIAGRWSDSISSGDEAWSMSRLALSYQNQDYVIEALYRADTYYQFANETAQVLYLAENHLPLEPGRRYPLLIKPNKLSSSGFRFGLKAAGDSLQMTAYISLLKPTKILQGQLSGSALALDTNDYDLEFSSDLVYDADPLYDRPAENISGQGYALDLTLAYQPTKRWRFDLELLDIAGHLSIDHAPYTSAEATSDIKSFDPDGFVTYDPVVTGREGFRPFTYDFSLQLHFSADYRLANENSVIFQHHEILGFNYQRFIYRQNLENSQLSWQLIPKVKALGVMYQTPYFNIGIEADSLDYRKMKFLSLVSQLFWTF
ncbi:MAG: hypothetical protein H8E21_13545 [Gammaproteobacteria bacterium]|nr:hypothetical protein [Gammaproteobacteria bacterium]MBL6998790.1 hypothetical protein [Gammaproteobacteria bacterium]